MHLRKKDEITKKERVEGRRKRGGGIKEGKENTEKNSEWHS